MLEIRRVARRQCGASRMGDRSDLGIDLKPLQELESFYNLDINQGVLVNSVDRNGAAIKAGLQSQDILLAMNDRSGYQCSFGSGQAGPIR